MRCSFPPLGIAIVLPLGIVWCSLGVCLLFLFPPLVSLLTMITMMMVTRTFGDGSNGCDGVWECPRDVGPLSEAAELVECVLMSMDDDVEDAADTNKKDGSPKNV